MNVMKIGYDGKRAVANMTGLGNYSRYAVGALAKAFPKNEYVLYAPKRKDNPRLAPLLEQPNVSLFVPGGIWTMAGSLWRSVEVTRQALADGIDIYHGLSNELPLNISKSGLPSVVTMHDVIWRRVPQDYNPIDRWLYDFKYGESAKNATRVIAISECTKRDLISDFNIDPEKIDVIYQGCDPQFSLAVDAEKREAARKKYGLPQHYIICVGTVQSRKNQLLAVKGLRALPQEVKLVIVGRGSKGYDKTIREYISKHGLGERVIWLENVPFTDFPALYAMARASAYVSRYEGFGIPVIESLSMGTPVIAATGSCLEEAGGRGAVYVNPDDEEEYAAAALKLLEDNYYHDKLAAYGRQHIKKFTTAEFAQRTMNTYAMAVLSGNLTP